MPRKRFEPKFCYQLSTPLITRTQLVAQGNKFIKPCKLRKIFVEGIASLVHMTLQATHLIILRLLQSGQFDQAHLHTVAIIKY